MRIDGIEIQDYLDAKEERYEALKRLRNIVFDLVVEWHEQFSDHPAHIRESERIRSELLLKISERMLDYEMLMWDFKKDWDFDDKEMIEYGLKK